MCIKSNSKKINNIDCTYFKSIYLIDKKLKQIRSKLYELGAVMLERKQEEYDEHLINIHFQLDTEAEALIEELKIIELQISN